jgi:predicted ATPase
MLGPSDERVLPPWATLSRALRRAHGLAQEDWAAWLQVSRKTVQRWERGTAAPSDAVEQRLLEFCADKDVFGRIARGVLDLDVDSPASLRDALAAARVALAAPATPSQSPSAIGRGPELQELRARLRRHRLITVVGPGGVGKTTLAHALADADTIVARLDTIRDPDLVLAVIAEATGTLGGRSLREGVVQALTSRPRLLVLDNFEHLPEAAPLVADLLSTCPDLRVLVTSRAPLHLAHEVVYELRPLRYDGDDPAAVALFVERALAVDPDSRHADGDRELIQSVCAALEGLPLAIELAAARLRHITLADLAARIDRAIDVLGSAPRDGAPRHRTLGDAIGWSVDLLTEREQALLFRLSRFVVGASLDAIEAVGEPPTLDPLAALVDHSLVARDGNRYRMLETVRQYCARRGAAAASDDGFDEFAAWAVEFARHHAAQMRGQGLTAALTATTREYPNLRAALSELHDRSDLRRLDLAIALCPFWDGRSMLHEARRFLEPAVGAGARSVGAAEARIWIGYFAAHQGDLAVAARVARQAEEYFAARGVAAGVGYAAMVLGFVAAEQARHRDAEREWQRSVAALEASGDRWGLVRPLNNLGELARTMGDPATARARHHQALAICRELGDDGSLPSVLCALAHAELDRGDSDAGLGAAREALAIARRIENRVGEANALEALARAEFEIGAVDAAIVGWARASAVRAELSLPMERRDRDLYERQLRSARARVGADRFAAQWAQASAAPEPSCG